MARLGRDSMVERICSSHLVFDFFLSFLLRGSLHIGLVIEPGH